MSNIFKTIGNVLVHVGGAVISNVIPGGSLIIDGINALLPDDKKLPNTATGTDALNVISSLPADKQAEILNKEYDVEIAEINSWERIQGHLMEADKAGSSTRPKIAIMMAYIVAFTVVVFTTSWAVCIVLEKAEVLKQLKESWPMMIAVLGTPTALLRSYFGMRTKEKQSRYSAALGQPVQGNFISDLIKGFMK